MSRKIKNFYFPLLAKRCLCAMLIALSVLSASGCTSGTKNSTKTLRVGLAIYKQDDTFISGIVQAVERFALQEEGKHSIKINISLADGRGNQTLQMEQIDRFLSQKYDVICVNIVDRTMAAVMIDKAKQADIPLIFFNRQPVDEDINLWEKVYYVGAKAEDSGLLQGEIVRAAYDAVPETVDKNSDGVLQYVMLEGEPGHQDALLRTQFSIQCLTTKGVLVEKLANETANWNRGQATGIMAQWLQEHGSDIEVVFANNDDMALGAIDALQESGVVVQDMPMVVGVDATPPALEAIRAGTLKGTVENPGTEIARAMLSLVLELKSSAPLSEKVQLEDKHYVWLPYRIVTAENLEDLE